MERSRYFKNLIALAIVAAIIIVGAIVASQRHQPAQTVKSTTKNQPSRNANDPASYVSYSLPSGFAQAKCDSTSLGTTYLIRPGTDTGCGAPGASPILIRMDLQTTTDCNQIHTGDGVTKHTCISLFIDGHKALKSITDYSGANSPYGQDAEEETYYLKTGTDKAVVQLTLVTLTGSDNTAATAAFNQIIQTVHFKNA